MPISFQEIVERRGEATFPYAGHEVNISFWADKVTQEFRAELMRLSRAAAKLRLRQAEYNRVAETADVDGADDTEFEAAFSNLLAEDKRLKAQIDAAVLSVLAGWDVTNGPEPLPISPETLFPMPIEFEMAIISAIGEAAKPMGEGNGQRNTRPLPYSLKPKAKRVRSHQRQIG